MTWADLHPIHIGHGTFLEHLDLGAREMGYAAVILPFPEGELDPPTASERGRWRG